MRTALRLWSIFKEISISQKITTKSIWNLWFSREQRNFDILADDLLLLNIRHFNYSNKEADYILILDFRVNQTYITHTHTQTHSQMENVIVYKMFNYAKIKYYELNIWLCIWNNIEINMSSTHIHTIFANLHFILICKWTLFCENFMPVSICTFVYESLFFSERKTESTYALLPSLQPLHNMSSKSGTSNTSPYTCRRLNPYNY